MFNLRVLCLIFVFGFPVAIQAGGGDGGGHVVVQRIGENGLTVKLANRSNSKMVKMWERTALAGKGGGNLLFLVVNRLGQVVPSCSFIDSVDGFGKVKGLAPRLAKNIWQGNLNTLSRMHCLDAGVYSASFVYVSPEEGLLFSPSFEFSAK